MRKMTAIRQSKPKKNKQRVAAYCRVSTDRTEQQHSFEMQRAYFQKIYSSSDALELIDVYTDTTSGTSSLYRPGFQRLMSDCRAGKIDRIVTKSLSRFARNTKDCLTTLREMKRMGVTVHFEKEGIDTANVSDEIMITIMEGLAQEEAASISRNVRWSLKRRMANGTLGIARVPYGYKMENGVLLVNEEEAVQICRIFEMRVNGMGVYAIGKMLYKEQIPFFSDTRDKAIKKASAILYKPIYMGAKGYLAIIDKDTFDKIQTMKPQAFRKPKNEESADTKNEEYEYTATEETEHMRAKIEQMITDRTVDVTAVREMIFALAAQNYSCIHRKEDAL